LSYSMHFWYQSCRYFSCSSQCWLQCSSTEIMVTMTVSQLELWFYNVKHFSRPPSMLQSVTKSVISVFTMWWRRKQSTRMLSADHYFPYFRR
jgi:hypothetical protein